jgi:hypothetical protein
MNIRQNHLEKLIELQVSLKQYIKARNESIKISSNPPQWWYSRAKLTTYSARAGNASKYADSKLKALNDDILLYYQQHIEPYI